MVENLIDGIAGDEDSVPRDALAHEILLAAVRIGHQDVAAVIDDSPVYLLRHSVIVASIAGLHVIHRDAEALGTYRAQTAVCVAQQENAVGAMLEKNLLRFSQDPADLLSGGVCGKCAWMEPRKTEGLPSTGG